MCLLSFVYNQNTVTSVNEIPSLKKFAVWGVGGIVKGLNHSSVSTEQGIYDWIDTGTIWHKWWWRDRGTEWNLKMLLHLKRHED